MTPPSRRGRLTRRLLLGGGLAAAAGAATGVGVYTASYKTNDGQLTFTDPLPVPPILAADPNGQHILTLRSGRTQFRPGTDTDTWGINGDYLGPTLRLRTGRQAQMTVTNQLLEATTLHWHGMRLPARMDGGPHQLIQPAQQWRPTWTVEQPAATLWYHPHLHGRTAVHVYRGLAGLLIIDDDHDPGLPNRYGIDDIPLILQDKQLTADGQLQLATGGPLGVQGSYGLLGDTTLVNGAANPHLVLTCQRIRFRLLNAANSRSFNIGFGDDRPFHLVGTDHGLLPAPLPMNRIRLASGERAEIVADFTAGEQVLLRSYPPLLAGGFPQDRIAGATDQFDLLALRASAQLQPAAELPNQLTELPAYQPPPNAVVRRFQLAGISTINGRAMDMSRIDEIVPAGTTEIWVLDNPGNPHSFHVHEAGLDILDVNGQPPPPYLTGRKDTVYLPPSTTTRIAIRFGRHTSPTDPYMYHCHMLEHEDLGMMGQFVLVPPGTESQVDRQPPNLAGDSGPHSGHR